MFSLKGGKGVKYVINDDQVNREKSHSFSLRGSFWTIKKYC